MRGNSQQKTNWFEMYVFFIYPIKNTQNVC